MSEKTCKQNQNKIEGNKDSNNILNSPEQKKIVSKNLNNSITNNDNLNIENDKQNLTKINKELENIALTGETKYSWTELRPYIIYFYEKNVKNFCLNKKNSMDLSYLNNGETSLPFSEKKEIKEIQMDLKKVMIIIKFWREIICWCQLKICRHQLLISPRRNLYLYFF